MIDVSGRGTGILLTSIPILPVGLWIDQWPDDTDPFDVPGVDIAEVAMSPQRRPGAVVKGDATYLHPGRAAVQRSGPSVAARLG